VVVEQVFNTVDCYQIGHTTDNFLVRIDALEEVICIGNSGVNQKQTRWGWLCDIVVVGLWGRRHDFNQYPLAGMSGSAKTVRFICACGRNY
jgi:hypothetical protein